MSEKKIALFPGSFDPFTIGHESILKRAADLFDKIIVGVGVNSEKRGLFSVEKRLKIIEQSCRGFSNITAETYSGLTVDYCKKNNIKYILRGLRTSADFEFERAVGQMNKKLHLDIETVFFLSEPDHTPISSSVVREILKYGGNVSSFVPAEVNIYEFL